MAKLGSGWTGAWTSRIFQGRKFYGCPRCGEVCKEEDEEGRPSYAVTDAGWFEERKRRCHACDEPLWQMVRLKDHQPWFPPLDPSPMGWLRNPPPVRYPLAEFILRQYKGFFDLAIIDEAHRYNAESTDQVYAYRALAKRYRRRSSRGTPQQGRMAGNGAPLLAGSRRSSVWYHPASRGSSQIC